MSLDQVRRAINSIHDNRDRFSQPSKDADIQTVVRAAETLLNLGDIAERQSPKAEVVYTYGNGCQSWWSLKDLIEDLLPSQPKTDLERIKKAALDLGAGIERDGGFAIDEIRAYKCACQDIFDIVEGIEKEKRGQ
jgi:hypothetical protein